MTAVTILPRVLHTEHSYVSYAFCKIDDTNMQIFNQLNNYFNNEKISFYKNHFVIEGIDDNGNKLFIGYNDNVLSIGSDINTLEDSISIPLVKRIRICLNK